MATPERSRDHDMDQDGFEATLARRLEGMAEPPPTPEVQRRGLELIRGADTSRDGDGAKKPQGRNPASAD